MGTGGDTRPRRGEGRGRQRGGRKEGARREHRRKGTHSLITDVDLSVSRTREIN